MSPLEMLARQLDGDTINQISRKVDADPEKTQRATAGIVETLMGAMARNVQTNPRQADRIERALERDNHAALFDNVGDLLSGNVAGGQYQRSMNGMGILQHILGSRTGRVADQVSKSSGLDPARVGQLMIMLAPLVMGALGKARKNNVQTNNGGGGIMDILGSVFQSGGLLGGTQQRRDGNPYVDAVLDRKGTNDDLVSMGTKLLGGLFGGRR